MKIRFGVIFVVLISFVAWTGFAAQDHKPRRGKFYVSPDEKGRVTVEEVEEIEVVEEKSFLDQAKKDSRLKPWINWWRQCVSSFNMDELIDVGSSSISDEWRSYDKSELEGPNGKLLLRSGGKTINPVWGRMKYVKGKEGWEPRYGPRCGVVMYQNGKAKTIIHCGELDGIFQAFWAGKDRMIVTAYRKIAPEMNAECMAKNVGECVSAVLYLADLKKATVWEYRGPVVTFSKCEPNDFLVRCYPFFYIQPEEEEAMKAAGKE